MSSTEEGEEMHLQIALIIMDEQSISWLLTKLHQIQVMAFTPWK